MHTRVVAALIVVLLAGCATDDRASVGVVDGPVLTVGSARQVAVMDAILAGRITLDPDTGCLGLAQGDGRNGSLPTVWPSGTRWQESPAAIVLPDGRVIRVGATVSAGGGGVPPAYVGRVAGAAVRRAAERCRENASSVAMLQSFPSGDWQPLDP